MRGLPHYPLPDLKACMDANLAAAKLTNTKVKFIGASINTKGLDEAAAKDYLAKVEREIGLPTVDPIRTGVGRIADQLS
jgi:uncharacterized NAD-dependent epimerase/dehydratase family protein